MVNRSDVMSNVGLSFSQLWIYFAVCSGAPPFARAPRREDLLVAATVIAINGEGWSEAKRLAEQIYTEADNIVASTYRAPLIPGVEDALRRMRDAGAILAIATNAPHVSAEDLMKSVGLHGMFEAIIGADDVSNPKPTPDVILLACERCGCLPKEAIYIGDMPMDIDAGRGASVNAVIAVKSGYLTTSSRVDYDVIMDSYDELQVSLSNK